MAKLNVTMVGDKVLIESLLNSGYPVLNALKVRTTFFLIKLQGLVLSKLHGKVLHQRSGNLAASIQKRQEDTAAATRGFVYSSGDVKYARIHEFGGLIHHPGGTAYIPGLGPGGLAAFISNRAAAGLDGMGHGVPRTQPHDIPMPERSFLRSSLNDMSEEIRKGYLKAAKGALKQQVLGRA